MEKRAEFDKAMSEYIKRKVRSLCTIFVVNDPNLILQVMPVDCQLQFTNQILNICRKVARVTKLRMMKITISEKSCINVVKVNHLYTSVH